MRKVFFDDEENGYFKTEKRPNANPLSMGGKYLYRALGRGGGGGGGGTP